MLLQGPSCQQRCVFEFVAHTLPRPHERQEVAVLISNCTVRYARNVNADFHVNVFCLIQTQKHFMSHSMHTVSRGTCTRHARPSDLYVREHLCTNHLQISCTNQLIVTTLHKKLYDMTSPSQNTLQRLLTKKLDLHHTGGSLFVRDDETLILTDKFLLSAHHMKLIETNFPHVTIDIVSSTGSHSWFLVVFSCRQPYDHAWQRSLLQLAMHLALFICILAWTCPVNAWSATTEQHRS
jgi:hypothetical protein